MLKHLTSMRMDVHICLSVSRTIFGFLLHTEARHEWQKSFAWLLCFVIKFQYHLEHIRSHSTHQRTMIVPRLSKGKRSQTTHLKQSRRQTYSRSLSVSLSMMWSLMTDREPRCSIGYRIGTSRKWLIITTR